MFFFSSTRIITRVFNQDYFIVTSDKKNYGFRRKTYYTYIQANVVYTNEHPAVLCGYIGR